MTVEVSIFLFGKPAWEIDGFEVGEMTEDMIERIRSKGKELSESLSEAAGVLQKLLAHGWNGSGILYDVSLFKDVTIREARRELESLDLDPNLAFGLEDEDDPEADGVCELKS
ncbi:MAG: hypothetical protein OK422_03370 [Thaumarchaeota archaeon]|nr:hypothetical protein [Nitrososphaerota archaeon]